MHATYCIRWRCKWLVRPNAMWLILIWIQSGNNWHETVKWVWHVEGALSSLCSNMFFVVLNVHIHLVVQDTSKQGEVLSLCCWKRVVYRSLNVVWNTLKLKSTSRFEDSSSLFFFFLALANNRFYCANSHQQVSSPSSSSITLQHVLLWGRNRNKPSQDLTAVFRLHRGASLLF